MASVAYYLVTRRLVAFKNLLDVLRAGEVTLHQPSPFQLDRHMAPQIVTDPNMEITVPDYGNVPVVLSVKNRGNLAIYKPLYQGKFLKVERYDYTCGEEYIWEVVERAAAIVAVPVLEGDKIVLARMYRPAVNDWLHEVPAGMMDPNEQAADTALRELEEETGYTAGRVDFLWSAYSSPGFTTEEAHFWLCTHLRPGEQHLDAEEQIEPCVTTISDAFDMIRRGGIRDMKTIAAITFLQASKEQFCRNLPTTSLSSAT